jgi:hypothetical protein
MVDTIKMKQYLSPPNSKIETKSISGQISRFDDRHSIEEIEAHKFADQTRNVTSRKTKRSKTITKIKPPRSPSGKNKGRLKAFPNDFFESKKKQ